MNHQLSAELELLEQGQWGMQFGLTLRNRAPQASLLLPKPRIHNLHFACAPTMQECTWYTHLLVSADLPLKLLHPGQSWSINFRVRPRNVIPSESWNNTDYDRWCIELAAGEYSVWFDWEVSSTFHDGDSHIKMPDLEREAQSKGAIAWTGEVVSNRLSVRWPPGNT